MRGDSLFSSQGVVGGESTSTACLVAPQINSFQFLTISDLDNISAIFNIVQNVRSHPIRKAPNDFEQLG
jgi:hypothetical protein